MVGLHNRFDDEGEIVKPYLIQRVQFDKFSQPKDEFSATWDQVFSHDYMGAAEFEFGALPESMKFLCKNHKDLTITKFPEFKDFRGNWLAVIHHKNLDVQKYFEYIQQMAINKLHLKESTRLEAFMTGKYFGKDLKPDDYALQYDIWWDLENFVIFTFNPKGSKRAKKSNKILQVIGNTRDKKEKEKAEGWY